VSTSERGYHHGDLRAACLDAALALLETGDEADLSLRAVARRAGVSPNAPYRHYPDKDALLAALATRGYQQLGDDLAAADAAAEPGRHFVAMATAYVAYALAHPALFRLMFGHPCSRSHPETTEAAHAAAVPLAARAAEVVPPGSRDTFVTGAWSLVHGLAALLLDGKLGDSDPAAVVDRVITTMLPAST
jgi:AcrR family transcriptional regulator